MSYYSKKDNVMTSDEYYNLARYQGYQDGYTTGYTANVVQPFSEKYKKKIEKYDTTKNNKKYNEVLGYMDGYAAGYMEGCAKIPAWVKNLDQKQRIRLNMVIRTIYERKMDIDPYKTFKKDRRLSYFVPAGLFMLRARL